MKRFTDQSFNIQYHTIGQKLPELDIHRQIGRIFDLSFVIQYHTIDVNRLSSDIYGYIGRIFDSSFNIQNHTIDLNWLSSDIHGNRGRIFDLSFNLQYHAVLQQLKAKLLHEEYSENLLHQDARYRDYANNLERIVLKDKILTRQYFDETGNVKYHLTQFYHLSPQQHNIST